MRLNNREMADLSTLSSTKAAMSLIFTVSSRQRIRFIKPKTQY